MRAHSGHSDDDLSSENSLREEHVYVTFSSSTRALTAFDRRGSVESVVGVHPKKASVIADPRFRKRRWYFGLTLCVYVGSVAWNIASPIKSWYLARYASTVGSIELNNGIDWATPVDYGVAKGIYDAAGVLLDLPYGRSIRFVNILLDFMNFKKCTNWAHLIGPDHDDFYATRWCRTTLRDRSDQLQLEVNKFRDSGVPFWDWQAFEYIVEQQQFSLGEVSEAVLCLKGYNASQFLNLNWKTSLDPTDPDVHRALARYQELQLPDLDKCLARRGDLVASLGRKDGLLQLAHELSKNYSIDLHNRAGQDNLFLPVKIERGFVDISGGKSGHRVVHMAGKAPYMSWSNTVGVLTAIREVLWFCSGNALPANMSLYDCLDRYSIVYPGFTAAFFTSSWFTPLPTNPLFTQLPNTSQVALFEYTYEQPGIDPVVYLPESTISTETGTETAYRDQVDRTFFLQQFGSKIDWKLGEELMVERCWVQDGCFSACRGVNASNGLDIRITYSGVHGCQSIDVPHSVTKGGYVSEECYGMGKGNASIMWTFHPRVVGPKTNGMTHFVLNQTADPFDIFACLVGGRVPSRSNARISPQLPMATAAPTNTILTQSFQRGSEEIFANVYALVALLGCALFALGVLYETMAMAAMLQRVYVHQAPAQTHFKQLLFSVAESNVSTRVWEHYHFLLRSFGFVSLLAWYIGAVKTKCSWFAGDVDICANGNVSSLLLTNTSVATIEPIYKCKPGEFGGPLSSLAGGVRLVAISYNVFILVFYGKCVRGLTRTVYGFAVGAFFLGLLPTLVLSGVITAINRRRIATGSLDYVHNQLFVTILWFVALLVMRFVRGYLVWLIARLLRVLGVRQQRVANTRALRRFLGDYYFVLASEFVDDALSCVPLSVLLESKHFRIQDVHLASHRYLMTELNINEATGQVVLWFGDDEGATFLLDHLTTSLLLTASEYYVQF